MSLYRPSSAGYEGSVFLTTMSQNKQARPQPGPSPGPRPQGPRQSLFSGTEVELRWALRFCELQDGPKHTLLPPNRAHAGEASQHKRLLTPGPGTYGADSRSQRPEGEGPAELPLASSTFAVHPRVFVRQAGWLRLRVLRTGSGAVLVFRFPS